MNQYLDVNPEVAHEITMAGLAATPVGILIDRHGGRLVMAAGSLLCGIGFFLLSRLLD